MKIITFIFSALLFLFDVYVIFWWGRFRTLKSKKDETMRTVSSLGHVIHINGKKGVGKTTSSINLAASLGLLGKKTLLIDLDPQGNSTTGVGVNKGELESSIYELLVDKAEVKRVVAKTKFKNLYIVELSAIEGVSTLLDCFFSVNQNTGEVDTFVPLENPEFFNNDKIEHIWL